MGHHGSSGKSHRHGHSSSSKEHRKHRHAQATPAGYGQWPPADYYNGSSSRRRRGGMGRKLIKFFLFLVLIGAAVGGGWYGMQMLNAGKDATTVAKKKKKTTTAEEVAQADPEMKEEPKTEPKAEPKTEPKVETKKEETKVTPEPKTEPKVEPKVEPKKKDPPKEEMPKVDGPLVYFDKHILPIMQRHCIRCHGEGNKKFDGKFDARTVAAIMKGGESGDKSIEPGKPDKSNFWILINDNQMPPKGEGMLTAEEKKLINDWIKGGAKPSAAVAAN